ncbi:hypothetical protein N0V85_004951 [Neurospora sp. IMI 360204]|nr:hypothetical protein N0V85_004951 [Neurospora sp. IMI 360204]
MTPHPPLIPPLEPKKVQKLWTPDNPVDLYCSSTGQSHAVLTTFGFWNCPKCGQSLRQPEFKKDVQTSGTAGPSGTSGAAVENQSDFKYQVRYLDSGEKATIVVDPLDGPFDLSEARKDLSGTAKKEPAFMVETEVITPINNGFGSYLHEVDRYKDGKILANPDITVKVGRTCITISSQPLREILSTLVSYYPSNILGRRVLTLWAPYEIVWHHHDLIEQYLSEAHGDEAQAPGRKELRQLVDFVKGMNARQVADEQTRHQKGMCTYEMLWLLYKPGTTVYVESRGRLAAFVISIVEYYNKDEPHRDKPRLVGFTIQMWNLDYDGIFVGRHAREEYIPRFEGEREITSLHIIPCEYKDKEDGGETRKGLISDGKRCDAINKLVMHEEKKKMIKALIHKYSDAKASDRGDDDESSDAWKADFIDNKGEGQIFLLHGSPGVGKTYNVLPRTDEIKMEKRLLNWFQLAEKWGAVMLIDEADVFLESRSTHDLKRNSLVSVFLRCVEYYRGVLFLTTNRVGQFDDAFMSRIHVVIHYRNLTTKDRRKIWEQFFEKLKAERDFDVHDRAEDYIFGKKRKDSDDDDSNSNSDNENDREKETPIVEMPWNGREIRNAFQTAVALAEFRHAESIANDKKRNTSKKTRAGPRLERKDFVQVFEMMQEFKHYLKSVHGVDEESRAYYAADRALPDGHYPDPSTRLPVPKDRLHHSREGML